MAERRQLSCSVSTWADAERNDLAINSLEELRKLPRLAILSLSSTPFADLSALSSLTALQSLDCSFTQVSDLSALSSLTALQSLDCGDMQVSDLSALSSLTALQSLDCGGTQVSDLSALSSLTALQSLDCSFTQVSDLSALSSLTALQSLDCGDTPVSDLSALSSLTALQSLDCSGCGLNDLPDSVRNLPSLTKLVLFETRIPGVPAEALSQKWNEDCLASGLSDLPEAVRNLPSLTRLVLFETRIPGVPAEALSQIWDEDCLASVRAHYQDLAAGQASVADVKLIVLGNGRVGKTQICRRLRGEDYDPDEPSTHGIRVTSALLSDGAESIRLNIWDFGGQDLYHGTHALFLRTNAIFLLVWATETENTQAHEHQGVTYRNQPLAYWLAYVRHLAGTASPLLIVQTRCDRQQDEALHPPLVDADVEGFAFRPVLHYSALNDRKREGLDGTLREAVSWLRERQGVALIGIGRMRVQRALQDMRDADAAVPPEQRQYRTITQEQFRRLCDEAGNVSSPEELLRYLNNAGIVFYRPGLFQDCIVLDQGWALNAIYAVFNRDKCWRELKRLHGRFSRPLLEALAWGKHSAAEQKLFLDMMLSCGICFVHRAGLTGDDDATEYIAPDLLPDRSEVQDELDEKWDAQLPAETAEFDFAMLHPGLVRGLICEVGSQAGVNAVYWQGGVCGYDKDTRSHALIQQEMPDGWRGRIRIATQGGNAALLLARLSQWVEQRAERGGLRAVRIGKPALPLSAEQQPLAADAAPASFGAAPVAQTEYFVSYAWGDDASPEGREREAIVDRLCAEAEERRIRILRDKTTLRIGDRISPFMRRIGAGDRVFVILSEKYLHSPYCMFELWALWRYSRDDEADFRRRVRIFALPDARAGSPVERIRLAVHWKTQYDEIAALIKDHGADIIGDQDFARFKLMGDFYRHVPDVLATMFDTVQPRSFEQLVQYGFDDLPEGAW